MAMGLQGFQDSGPACIEFLELIQPLPDGGDGHLIKATGGLLAIAGNEWDGGILLEQFYASPHPGRLQFEFTRNDGNMVWGHDFLSFSSCHQKQDRKVQNKKSCHPFRNFKQLPFSPVNGLLQSECYLILTFCFLSSF